MEHGYVVGRKGMTGLMKLSKVVLHNCFNIYKNCNKSRFQPTYCLLLFTKYTFLDSLRQKLETYKDCRDDLQNFVHQTFAKRKCVYVVLKDNIH